MPAPPEVLWRLCDRFDATAFDAPTDRARLRLVVDGEGEWDFVINGGFRELEPAEEKLRPDARLCADRATWSRIGRDLRGGMNAFRRGRLQIRDNLHLGVGFLAATSGSTDPARLEMGRVRTSLGDIAVARAGDPHAQPVVMLHGLGGTKGSFLPTVAALADSYRTLAIDLPGFGDSVKPVGAAYDPRFFAKAVCHFMDADGIESAHLIGNSMGGRVALEVGFEEGFWTRRRALERDSLFVWGRHDRLVPIAFARHVREALPAAQHVELECGHVPQLEAPKATHAAVRRFLGAKAGRAAA